MIVGMDSMQRGQTSACQIPRSAARIDLLAIAAVWCVSVIITNPLGDFPLNDDWSYGLTVKHLIETGNFRPCGWTAMPLITQVLWGALFCLPVFHSKRFDSPHSRYR